MLLHTHSIKRENALHVIHMYFNFTLTRHQNTICALYTSVEKLCIEATVTGPLPFGNDTVAMYVIFSFRKQLLYIWNKRRGLNDGLNLAFMFSLGL